MELAARYSVSQGTVRKAIDELSAENLLVRKQGKGTFVATHQEDDWQYRFLRLVPDSGQKVVLKSHFLSCNRIKANLEIATALKLKGGDSIILIDRVQSFSGTPIAYEQIWLSAIRFKGLSLDSLNAWFGPLYAFYESKFATHMVRAEEKIKAVSADAACASHLRLSIGSPVLSVERISYTYGNKPVEMRRSRYDTTEQHYENNLN